MNMSDKPVPASIECQSEIDKDLVRAYYGDIGAFYRVRAALAATPAVKEATQAQHFDLPKGEPARFVRNGILETCECTDCAALAATPAVGGEALQETISNAIMKIVSNRDDLGYTHFIEIRDSIFAAIAAPPASPLRGREIDWPAAKVTNPDIADPTGIPYVDCLLHRLLDAQQDINVDANECMSQRLADAADLIDEVETAIRKFAASPPEQPAAGCGDPSCKDPDCTYGKGTNYLAQPAAVPFQPHENCNCLMCLAEKSR